MGFNDHIKCYGVRNNNEKEAEEKGEFELTKEEKDALRALGLLCRRIYEMIRNLIIGIAAVKLIHAFVRFLDRH